MCTKILPAGGKAFGRPHVYFASFLPDDERFLTGKRGSPGYETALVMDPEQLHKEVDLYMTANGCIITPRPVSPEYVWAVYQYQKGEKGQ